MGEHPACSLDELIESYKGYLTQCVPKGNAQQYDQRLTDNFEAAATEAVVFCMLQQYGLEPLVYERVGQNKSRPDFVCGQGVNKSYVEATSFREDKVTRGTKLPARDIELDRAYNFELVTREICQRVEEKSSKYEVRAPLVLVLGSDHAFSNIVFGRLGIQFAMTGKSTITGNGRAEGETEFAVFLRLGKHEKVEPRHQDISCVLLLQLGGTSWRALGMLHPDPCHTIPANLLRDVPFACISPWPPRGRKVNVGWISDPAHAPLNAYRLVHRPDRASRPPTGKP